MSNDKSAATGYQPPLYAIGERIRYDGLEGRIVGVGGGFARDGERIYGVALSMRPTSTIHRIPESKIELLDYSPRVKHIRPARLAVPAIFWFALGVIAGAGTSIVALIAVNL